MLRPWLGLESMASSFWDASVPSCDLLNHLIFHLCLTNIRYSLYLGISVGSNKHIVSISRTKNNKIFLSNNIKLLY